MSSTQDACKILAGSTAFIMINIFHVISRKIDQFLTGNDINYKPEPFLKTYVRSSVFVVFLVAQVFKIPWRSFFDGFQKHQHQNDAAYSILTQNEEVEHEDREDDEVTLTAEDHFLEESNWVPINGSVRGSNSGSSDLSSNEGDQSEQVQSGNRKKSKVRFNRVTEVRQLSPAEADEAFVARLSYQATKKIQSDAEKNAMKISPIRTIKLSFKLSFAWFFANYFQELALMYQSTYFLIFVAGLTVALSLIFKLADESRRGASLSNEPRISVVHLSSVLLTLAGLVFVSAIVPKIELTYAQPGLFWAILSALFQSMFIIILRNEVDHDERLDIPFFLGLIGLFNMITLWPGFFLSTQPSSITTTSASSTSFPSSSSSSNFLTTNTLMTFNQIGFIVSLNLFTSALVEVAWIWSCLMTSVLISSTSNVLKVPVIIAMDSRSLLTPFWLGTVLLIASFAILTLSTSLSSFFPSTATTKLVSNTIYERSKSSLTSLRGESLFSSASEKT